MQNIPAYNKDYPKGKQLLVKLSGDIAKRKHPNGFGKKQLVDASKEVYGGFASNRFKQVRTMEDVSHRQNVMANIEGCYPLGMTGCEVVGISGDCGLLCPVLREGDCESKEGMFPKNSSFVMTNIGVAKYDCDEEVFYYPTTNIEVFIEWWKEVSHSG